MNQQETFNRVSEKFPHVRQPFFARPHATRREWFKILGAGVTASVLSGNLRGGVVVDSNPVATVGKAKNVIFILMAGAPSAVDTFDFKMYDGVTPSDFNPSKVNGIDWPVGLLPKLATHLPELAIVRSMRASSC